MVSLTPSHKRPLYPNHRKRGLANGQLLFGGFPYMILPRTIKSVRSVTCVMAFALVNIVENEEWNVNTGVVQTQYHRASLLVRHRGKALIGSVLTRLSFPNLARSATPEFDFRFRLVPVSGSEEIQIPAHTCMLLDCQNRLSFVGRSTAHSFMHHIRNTIEKRDGPSEFTADSNWSGLPERLPVAPRMPSFLSPSATASLIDFYFNHVRSFIDIVNPEAVSLTLYQFQNNPNEVQGPDRCIFYLVLAVALALDYGDSAHSPSPEFKHQLFAIAEGLAHPTRTFEKSQYHDDVLWPLQALALMSFFMMSVSMRNTAYEYCGKSHRICMRTIEANMVQVELFELLTPWGFTEVMSLRSASSPPTRNSEFYEETPFAISDNEYSESSLIPPNRPSSPNKVPKRDMLDPPIDASVEMVKGGFHANLLRHSDPIALYVLFEAALVLLSSTYADIYAQKEHLLLVEDAMFILKTWHASSPYAEQFASKLDLFRHDVERQEQVKAIRQASRRQAHKVKREPMTTYEPSQYRSPFQQLPRGSLVSLCDSRRVSGTANHTMIKQEAGGYSGSLTSRPLFSPTDFNMDQSQSFAEYSQSTNFSDHSIDID
ncbi:transcriptional regulatory [Fusarium pseudocircinatum]|uniref:Transcriptional regulatory n=1 Tax=Fusarium pseudocircinatum TaxID=56676 RepID=A0A8H5NUH8_9HYPO|nr:transcriptional regulatory [Fusarium pseudocircinatum]